MLKIYVPAVRFVIVLLGVLAPAVSHAQVLRNSAQSVVPRREFEPLPLRTPRKPRVATRSVREADSAAPLPGPPTDAESPTSPSSDSASQEERSDNRVAELLSRTEELTDLSKQIEDLDEAARLTLDRTRQSILKWASTIEAANEKIATYEDDMATGAERIREIRAQLAAPTLEGADSHLGRALNNLETQLLEAKNQLKIAQEKAREQDDEASNRVARKAELIAKAERANELLAELEGGLTPNADDPNVVTSLREVEYELRRLGLQAQHKLYETQIKRYDRLAELFPLQRDLALRQSKQAEKQVGRLQDHISKVREDNSQVEAKEARSRADDIAPELRELADYNAKLAEQRAQLTNELSKLAADIKIMQPRLKQLDEAERRARNRIEKAGHSTSVGLMLRRQRENLADITNSEKRLREIESETPRVNLRRLELQDERALLLEPHQEAIRIIQRLRHEREYQTEEPDPIDPDTVQDLLIARTKLLDATITDLDTYLFDLTELEAHHRELAERTSAFMEFIDEHVLWIRSAEPIALSDINHAGRGIMELAEPLPWYSLLKRSGLGTLKKPLMAAAVLISMSLLLSIQSWLKTATRELCQNNASHNRKFSTCLKALALLAVRSAEWPLLAWYLGWSMTIGRQTELGNAFGPALQHTAILCWLSGFVRSLCRKNGVAATFFGWSQSDLNTAKRTVRRLTWVGVPLVAIVITCQLYQQGAWTNSLGRLAFIAVMCTLIGCVYVALAGRHHLFRIAIAKNPKSWLRRVRMAGLYVGIGVPAALAMLAASGYYFSAQQLAVRLQTTLGLALACLVIHAVVSHWFNLQRRVLAVREAKDRLREEQDREKATDANHVIPSATVNDHPDWNEIHDRLRLLLRQAITVVMLTGVWFAWSDVLPALKALDRVTLWTQVADVHEFEDIDGELVETTRTVVTPTTLRNGVIAAIVLLGTFVVGRNLPALLEMTILNRLPLDRGGRHAVSVIAYYCVALAGMLIACGNLHITWSSVQWLAAGITVGLGFGLQEIFANFVSGMILLFERPIRVGDIITLDDVTGTVTNIRIRATTVTNWDRKELIVPNKELITGRLLNWTLTDTTNRIVINVGIGYDSDAEEARRVILDTVRDHSNILADPNPLVTFESFGDSTLNFVVRAYLSSLDVRLETIHQLHVGLHRNLREAGIEIAFPQRDLNIRSLTLPKELPWTGPLPRSEAA